MTSTSVSAAGPRPPIALGVNGRAVTLAVADDAPLLQVLRNDLGLNSPKYGCGLGECGACTVLIDGVAARACVVPLAGTAGREVTTLEGLGTGANLHPVQQAFIAAQAAQCGYCLAGMIMSTVIKYSTQFCTIEHCLNCEEKGVSVYWIFCRKIQNIFFCTHLV